ncbi:ABC transporter ATP-binding protein [Photobacterium sp. Hal280]|uniref:ABC transporter ATP-binding protein n=1 Tax=Photobacterium sp. Hal280 TaxID=3035163 RepID=UPI00301C2CDC
MAHIQLRNITKHYGQTEVLKGIDLEINDREFVTFVGPSGCGKSTLLRMISGLEEPSSGTISIDGEDVTREAPADRGIAMVFQSYALYPQMTVWENMAFALTIDKQPKALIKEKVDRAGKMLKLDHLFDRLPKALSGGQRQRVAIGRAIVRNPKLFLFDEPLSNLDAELRVDMRIQIAELHRSLSASMVYVTHDQVEAMTLADKIVVLRDGRIEQVGAPLELYYHPANQFVAGFIGSPKMNFIPVTVIRADADSTTVSIADQHAITIQRNGSTLNPGDHITLGIRPEHLLVATPDSMDDGSTVLNMQINVAEYLGALSYIHCYCDDIDKLSLMMDGEKALQHDLQNGARMAVSLRAEYCHLFDQHTHSLPPAC